MSIQVDEPSPEILKAIHRQYEWDCWPTLHIKNRYSRARVRTDTIRVKGMTFNTSDVLSFLMHLRWPWERRSWPEPDMPAIFT